MRVDPEDEVDSRRLRTKTHFWPSVICRFNWQIAAAAAAGWHQQTFPATGMVWLSGSAVWLAAAAAWRER